MKKIVTLLFVGVLAACGGGGGTSENQVIESTEETNQRNSQMGTATLGTARLQ